MMMNKFPFLTGGDSDKNVDFRALATVAVSSAHLTKNSRKRTLGAKWSTSK